MKAEGKIAKTLPAPAEITAAHNGTLCLTEQHELKSDTGAFAGVQFHGKHEANSATKALDGIRGFETVRAAILSDVINHARHTRRCKTERVR